MRNTSWLLTTFLVVAFCTICWGAEAQFPKPRPSSAPQTTTTTVQTSPAPPVQAPPPVVNVAPPNVTISPQLVAPPASTLDGIRTWLNTAFLGLLTAIGGWIAARGVKTSVPGSVAPADILLTLRDRAADPATRAKIDETLLTVLGTGIPSKIVQGGLGFVPVAGPALAGLEPLLHDAFMGFLKTKLEVKV